MVWLMCKILTRVTAARERPDTLRKAARANPLLATFLLYQCKKLLYTALQEQHCCTQKHGAKAQGCKHQQRETGLRELLSAISQEPVCVSCPKASLLIPRYLQNTIAGRCIKQIPEGRRG